MQRVELVGPVNLTYQKINKDRSNRRRGNVRPTILDRVSTPNPKRCDVPYKFFI